MSNIQFYSDATLNSMRRCTDPLAEQAIHALFQHADKSKFRQLLATLHDNSSRLPDHLPDAVYNFFECSRKLPVWADEKLMINGTAFFDKHASDLLTMLGLYSLPYCYASGNGAQVLFLTERLKNNALKRLLETGQYVFDVCSRNAFSKEGKAICGSQKVRLMHAAIRYYIKAGHQWSSEWGEPINQEDMAGTNLAMSLIAIRGLRKLGTHVSYQDAMAYIHLWNVAGYIMGIDEKLLPMNGKEAFILCKLIEDRQFQYSKAGEALTKSLLSAIQTTAPASFSRILPAYMRTLLGDEVADLLKLPKSSSGFLAIQPLKGINMFKSLINKNGNNYHKAYRQLHRQNVYSAKMSLHKASNFQIPATLIN